MAEIKGIVRSSEQLKSTINTNVRLKGLVSVGGVLIGAQLGKRGVKGDKGDTGDTGATGVGIASVEKTGTAGLVDTYTITFDDGNSTTFDVTNGQDGADGADGHSPVVTASKTGDTTTIYVDGTSVGTIVDGQDGTNGQDGHSPAVTASKAGKVTTVYVDGSSIATINDGNDGTNGQDGHSPVVTASKAGKVTTVSVDGSSIATINDGDDGNTGATGERGGIIHRITANINGYTTPVGDFTPVGRCKISDILAQSGADKVIVGDVLAKGTYLYGVGAVDSTYAYTTAGNNLKGDTGETGVAKIPSGAVDGTSTSTAFTATISGITELKNGVCVFLKNGVVTSASGFTVNINNLGAKPVYNNMAAASAETTIFNIKYTMLLVYDESRVAGGCWVCYRGYNSDTNTIGYQIRTNSRTKPASDKGYKYRLWFTSADGTKFVPANTSSSTNATASRTPNTTPIDPFGEIVYCSTNGSTNAAADLAAGAIWQQYTVALGYSFNTTGAALTLTYPAPVYIKCSPQTDGSAKLQGYTQALPSTADGYIYIYLGTAYSATNVELVQSHPVYYYADGAIRQWTNANASSGGTVTDVTVDGTSVLDGTVGKVVLTGKADAVHTHVKTDITDFPSLATVATSGSYSDLTNKPSIPTVTDTYSGTSSDGMSGKAVKSAIDALDGTVSGSAGASNTLTAFSQTDGKVSATFGSISITKSQVSDFPTIPANTSDLNNDSGFITGMVILSYGSSTWNDFISAYNANKVVYCRASSNANPATGSQTRLAFMAYVNNATTPTSVEFQYYRSVSSHSDAQQGDQVYVYKLESNGTWSVTVREAYSKVAVGTGISKSYSSGTITLSASETDPVFAASAAYGISASDIATWNGNSTYVCEAEVTTFAEAKAAYDDGKKLVCYEGGASNVYYTLVQYDEDLIFYFSNTIGQSNYVYSLDSEDQWTLTEFPIPSTSNLIIVDTYTATGYDFTASQNRSLTKSLTTHSGYTPYVLKCVCTNKVSLIVYNHYISSGTLTYEVVNRTSSSVTGANFNMAVMWIKNEILGS